MIIHNVAQGTQKWLDLRKGIPTCSRFDEIVTPAGELSKSAPKYMQHLLAERIEKRSTEKESRARKYLHHQPIKREPASCCGGVGCNVCEPQGRG